jgi:membrane-associated phospholipid phosphatase
MRPSSQQVAYPRADAPRPDEGISGRQSELVYRETLHPWRFYVRQHLLYLLDKETPVLAAIQRATRHPLLDLYFHVVSLLGTHSSFLLLLPLFFWFGLAELGTHMLIILATGVYLTSFLKDLVCVPRPYSPPVERMTLVGSHALEYGWPSTHSTNAVGICLIALSEVDARGKALLIFYAASVVLGRIYHGMHSISGALVLVCL